MNVIELGASLFDSILLVYFVNKFNRYPLTKYAVTVPAVLVIFGVTIINDKFFSGFNILTTTVFLLLYIGYALIVSNKNYVRAVVSACVFEIVLMVLSSVLYIIISIMVDEFDNLMYGSDTTVRYIYLLAHKVALFAVLQSILYILKLDNSLDIKNGLLTFAFSCITIFGLGTAIYIYAVMSDPKIQWQILTVALAFIGLNVLLYVLISQISKLQKSKYELKLLEEKLEFERARHNDAHAIWSNIRKIQHDIKHHLTVIGSQLENGETDDCKRYIGNLLPNVERMGNLIKSDNKILDYLINSKLSNLPNTEIIISGSIGSLADIKEFDLACLFGNILDNAVEAIQETEEKRIELLFLRQNSNRIIICKNTVKSPVLKTNKELKTTKKEKDAHGYGTKITEKIVADYHGMIDYFEEFNMFGVQIILPEQSEE
ncbi:MAG: GHKL domain-containing protein [Clostridia bacterium]|nr:GHKL domain-containing protein [Clostridia bacterium]